MIVQKEPKSLFVFGVLITALAMMLLILAQAFSGAITGLALLGNQNIHFLSVLDSDPALVGYWKFDEESASTAVDSSGKSGSLTMQGTPPQWTSGQINTAIVFDGVSNYAQLANYSTLNDLSAMTISVWAKPNSQKANAPFTSKADNSSGGHGWAFGTGSTPTKLSFTVLGFTGADLSVESTESEVQTDAWAHYAVTWDGTNQASGVHLYKNGVELTHSTQINGGSAVPQSDSARFLRMGRESGYGSNYYSGAIDDARVYGRILSSSEIQQIYKEGGGVIVPGSTGPKLLTISPTNITPTTATISWTTDKPSTTQVEYGLTNTYGNTTNLDTKLVTSHIVPLLGLNPNTTYHFRVRSKDIDQNETISVDYSFKTTATVQGTYSVTIINSGNGKVTSKGGAINCGTTCSASVTAGTAMEITAVPNAGYDFTGWSSNCSQNPTCKITINQNTTINANFETPSISSLLTAPTNLKITEDSEASATFDFYFEYTDNSNNEQGFIVEHSLDGTNYSPRLYLTGSEASPHEGGVTLLQNYWYRVRAYLANAQGKILYSAPSNVLNFTTISKPLYFGVYTTDPAKATIEFYDRSIKETGYAIERSDDGGKTYKVIKKSITSEWEFIPNAHSSPDKTKKFVDDGGGTGLPEGITYYYRVYAYDAVGNSPYAYPWPAQIGPSVAPSSPGITAVLTNNSSNGKTPTEIRVTLKDNSNNETKFVIERSTDNANWTSVGEISYSAGDKSWLDSKNILPNTSYYYRAKAVNLRAESAYTQTQSPVNVPATPPDGVTEWYVWKEASGPRSGESWQNAWRNLDEINWTAIKPGHTVYISGGTYDKGMDIFAQGAVQNYVTFRPGSAAPQKTGHDSKVILPYINITPFAFWIKIDGSIDPDFVPTSPLEVPQNINIDVNSNSETGIRCTGNYYGLSIRFVEVENSKQRGIELEGGSSDNVDIYGVYVHHTAWSGILLDGGSGRTLYDSRKIQKSLIEYTSDDGIQVGSNVTVKGNIIRHINQSGGAGHPDGIQSVEGKYLDISNNIIYDRELSSYFFVTRSASSKPFGHVRVYNNLFYYSEPSLSVSTEGVFVNAVSIYEPPTRGVFIPDVYWDDIVIANNTFVNMAKKSVINFYRRPQEVGNVRVSNYTVKNNLIYNCAYGGIAVGLKGPGPGDSQGFIYDTPTLKVENNLISGETGYNSKIEYNGILYTPEEFNSATGLLGNTSQGPRFVDYSGNDFRLSNLDSAARDKGQDLSYLGIEGLNTDFSGNQRGYGNGWDIGAHEYTLGQADINLLDGLVGHWNFDNDDFTTKRNDTYKTIPFVDSSPTKNTADCQSAFALNGTTYNQCPSITTGPDGSKAALFGGPPLCDNGADYIAIPPAVQIKNLPKGSISLWISSATNLNEGTKYYAVDTQEAFKPGTWGIIRDSDIYYTFTVADDVGNETDALTFPGKFAPAKSWNHYVLTWDQIAIKGYYNGNFFGQYPMNNISALNLSKYLALGAMMHGDYRNTADGGNCVRQYGAPVMNYVFPNAKFFSGGLDDIRIYNRPLTSSEINLLSESTNTPSNEYILRVTKNGTGTGSITGNGISCNKHCAESYPPATVINLIANPAYGSTFTGWSGACTGTGNCTTTINSSQIATATFTKTTQTIASFNAPDGKITPPFVVLNGGVSQTISTDAYTGGKAEYTFSAPTSGEYFINAKVNVPSTGSNSFYVNIDFDPTNDMNWHIQTTLGFEDRLVSWGGNSDGTNNPVKTFSLDAGTHTLIIRGRESGTILQSITIEKIGGEACTSFTYSEWGACDNGTQTRTILSQSPAGCTGGNPITTQACSDGLSVQIISPQNNSTFVELEPFDINASAHSTNGSVLGIELFLDGKVTPTKSCADAVCNVRLSGLEEGTHTITAVATDDTSQSATITITITVTSTSANFNPADTDKDWTISASEFLIYGSCYMHSICETEKVTQNYFFNAGTIFKHGLNKGYYYEPNTTCPPSDPGICWKLKTQ